MDTYLGTFNEGMYKFPHLFKYFHDEIRSLVTEVLSKVCSLGLNQIQMLIQYLQFIICILQSNSSKLWIKQLVIQLFQCVSAVWLYWNIMLLFVTLGNYFVQVPRTIGDQLHQQRLEFESIAFALTTRTNNTKVKYHLQRKTWAEVDNTKAMLKRYTYSTRNT